MPKSRRPGRNRIRAASGKSHSMSDPATGVIANGNGPAKTYRHKGKTRPNIPPAAIAAEGRVPAVPKLHYTYSPRLDPVLRFDTTGASDKLPHLLEKAKREPLTDAEAHLLGEALRRHDPWLEWAGKREANGFTVDPVALHIHERVSTQAILRIAAREDVTRDLFADPQFDYHEAVQFYRHEMDWSNRLILGDSLQVMASLAQREDLAGKVQMIYVDPPYGIQFKSNFQPEITKRKVGEKESDLTREPEMVKAYRDTWTLGLHSYLSYLRERFSLCRNLLADSGSIFVQISSDNVHSVRSLLDEVFGAKNFLAQIGFQKTGGLVSTGIVRTMDYLLWFAKDASLAKIHQVFLPRQGGDKSLERYDLVYEQNGALRPISPQEQAGAKIAGERSQLTSLESDNPTFPFEFEGHTWTQKWKTNIAGLQRLQKAGRIVQTKSVLRYLRHVDDFPIIPITDRWDSMQIGTGLIYVVQTSPRVIERCILLSTQPGDLVLDPTCGSATTAFVAEQWGRRWITIDTSRVAIALARQRLLTAQFEYYEIKDVAKGVDGGLKYKTEPHVQLKSIAQNANLDPIFAKHEPALEKALAACNAAIAKVPSELKGKLATKLIFKEKSEGKRAVTDADRRRWLLPPDNRHQGTKLTVDAKFRGWYHWEVPFETDPDWPKSLQDSVAIYRAAWRAKMDEVNACIQINADQEELVDQPEVRGGVVRVSGPFTVEAVQPRSGRRSRTKPRKRAFGWTGSIGSTIAGLRARATRELRSRSICQRRRSTSKAAIIPRASRFHGWSAISG